MQLSDIAFGVGVVLFVVLLLALWVWTIYSSVEDVQRARRQRERRERFTAAVALGLKNETVRSVDDFVLIFRGIFQVGSDDQQFLGEMSRLMREYLAAQFADENLGAADVERVKTVVAEALKVLERRAPFSDVPDVERNLLLDTVGFLRSGDTGAVERKLEQLAGYIVLRKEEVDRLQKSNRWATRIAVIGVFLTLLLGAPPLMSFIWVTH